MTELETMVAMLKHAEIGYSRATNTEINEWPLGSTILSLDGSLPDGSRRQTFDCYGYAPTLIFTRDGDLFSIEAYE